MNIFSISYPWSCFILDPFHTIFFQKKTIVIDHESFYGNVIFNSRPRKQTNSQRNRLFEVLQTLINLIKQSLILDGLPSDPVTWSELDVAAWLNKCNLGKYEPVFQGALSLKISFVWVNLSIFILLDYGVNGSELMGDSLQETDIRELIPELRDRILFNKERKSLRFV